MNSFSPKLNRIFVALAWRLRRITGNQRIDQFLIAASRVWRPLLRHPTFIGISGSLGKTTSKELALCILSTSGRCTANRKSFNSLVDIATNVLRTRPWHKFSVAELSEHTPGIMKENLQLFQPSICLITCVGDDHLSAFGSRAAISDEIRTLVHGLPATGTALINADDPAVAAMGDDAKCRIIRYGEHPDAELRATEVECQWPGRLKLKIRYGASNADVKTQLYGEHWLGAVLSSIGLGIATGMSLGEAASAVANARPVKGRMEPVTLTDEYPVFVRDDFKSPMWALESAFSSFKTARAKTKIVVIGEISEVRGKKGKRYAQVARMAVEIFDIVIFVGQWSTSALSVKVEPHRGKLYAVRHVRDASRLLKRLASPGDLVLLKGTSKKDHLERIVWDQHQRVACWRDDCTLNRFCSDCVHRNKPSQPPASEPDIDAILARSESTGTAITGTGQESVSGNAIDGSSGIRYVIGLGNAGDQFHGTPHNLGQDFVETIAETEGWAWRETAHLHIAEGNIGQAALTLIKVKATMNNCGREVVAEAESLGLSPENTLLVCDDIGLQMGESRYRSQGGAGGHNGLASVLEAFQSERFSRLRIGCKPASSTGGTIDLISSQFTKEEKAVIDSGINHGFTVLRKLIS